MTEAKVISEKLILILEHASDWQCWHMPLMPVFGKQRQADLFEFKASLVYIEFLVDQGYIVKTCLHHPQKKTKKITKRKTHAH